MQHLMLHCNKKCGILSFKLLILIGGRFQKRKKLREMLDLRDKELFNSVVGAAIEAAATGAATTTTARQWLNAIAKATHEFEQRAHLMSYDVAAQVLVVPSRTRANVAYRANGACQCWAFVAGQPCWHRAAAQLYKRYLEAQAQRARAAQYFPLHTCLCGVPVDAEDARCADCQKEEVVMSQPAKFEHKHSHICGRCDDPRGKRMRWDCTSRACHVAHGGWSTQRCADCVAIDTEHARPETARATVKQEMRTAGALAVISPRARTLGDLVTPKQLGMIRVLARDVGVKADDECQKVFKCATGELSKRAASSFIDYLKDLTQVIGTAGLPLRDAMQNRLDTAARTAEQRRAA